jgi:dienelactone hydrolase
MGDKPQETVERLLLALQTARAGLFDGDFMRKHLLWLVLAAVLPSGAAAGQELPKGQIIDEVQCRDDASQRYALYVPSTFTLEREWPVIFAFDAGGRGRRGVERYQAAAEKYGYIVAGSNNARNGPVEESLSAAEAMIIDVGRRVAVDSKRMYTAGMSGGARIAMLMALDSDLIAGVFASSAGFPDGRVQPVVRFPIFGSVGTDDFNYREMYALDRGVKTPHRVEVFDGGHTWLPVDVATNGVEWMEIQAMQSGVRARDQNLIDEIFAKRIARVEARATSLEKMRELKSIVADFENLKDVAKLAERAAALERQKDVEDGLKAERAEEDKERQTLAEISGLRDALASGGGDAFSNLKARVLELAEQSKAARDSTDRRIARRVLATLIASSRSISHAEFQELMKQIRGPGAGDQGPGL